MIPRFSHIFRPGSSRKLIIQNLGMFVHRFVRPHCDSLRNESRWLLGQHSNVRFWLDNWLGRPLIDMVDVQSSLVPPIDAVMGDVTSDARWSLPSTLQQLYPDIASEIDRVLFSTESDVMVRTCSLDGKVTCAGACASLIHAGNLVSCGEQIWAAFIPPSRSILTWKLLDDKLPTDQALK